MNVRVLIVSASGYGRGHEALADALVEELGVTAPAASVVVVDGMRETFGRLNRRGRDAYTRQIAQDPAGYGRGYALSALPAPARRLGQTFWLLATRALADQARKHRPEDVPRIERNFRRAYQRAELRVATATPPVDLRLHSRFSPAQRAAARRRFGLPEEAAVLLVSGGSLDYRLPDEDLQALLDGRPDMHVAVTTGKSDEFAAALRKVFPAGVCTRSRSRPRCRFCCGQ